MSALYKGFSSFEYQRVKEFLLTDVELVKMDLLNHIFTRRGSRVMMPNFGTIIPDLVFEPLDVPTVDIVEDELRKVFRFDPRVEVIKFETNVFHDRNLIQATADLFYIELDVKDRFELNVQFEQ